MDDLYFPASSMSLLSSLLPDFTGEGWYTHLYFTSKQAHVRHHRKKHSDSVFTFKYLLQNLLLIIFCFSLSGKQVSLWLDHLSSSSTSKPELETNLFHYFCSYHHLCLFLILHTDMVRMYICSAVVWNDANKFIQKRLLKVSTHLKASPSCASLHYVTTCPCLVRSHFHLSLVMLSPGHRPIVLRLVKWFG